MDIALILLSFTLIPLIGLGLINPRFVLWGRNRTRLQVVRVYGAMAIALLFAGLTLSSGIGFALVCIGLFILPVVVVAGLIYPPLVLKGKSRARVAQIYAPLNLFFLIVGFMAFKPSSDSIDPQSQIASPPSDVREPPRPTPQATPELIEVTEPKPKATPKPTPIPKPTPKPTVAPVRYEPQPDDFKPIRVQSSRSKRRRR